MIQQFFVSQLRGGVLDHQNASIVSAATVIADVIKPVAPEKEIPKVIGPDSAAL